MQMKAQAARNAAFMASNHSATGSSVVYLK